MVNAILASTSTVHGSGPLDYLLPELEVFFELKKEILFIPFARPGGITLDGYTENVQKSLSRINKKVKGIHQLHDPNSAIKNAEAIFTGGGNTFVLLNALYNQNLMNPLKSALK
ncbi:MAG: type 1 glutamine amidotransferase-like domain-containing protein, partial [Flavobacteriaceae bacterium]|nr:type 1 glutamine amidotransferase-like domain-containing protein [Flavobacteriaceae bacterium]